MPPNNSHGIQENKSPGMPDEDSDEQHNQQKDSFHANGTPQNSRFHKFPAHSPRSENNCPMPGTHANPSATHGLGRHASSSPMGFIRSRNHSAASAFVI